MKKILSAVLVCALAFSMCSCSMFGGSDKKSKSSTGSGVAETTAPLDKTKAESYVSTALEKKLPFSGDFQITGEKGLKNALVPNRMPQLMLDGDAARRINLEITAKYRVQLKTKQRPADDHAVDRVDYVCTLNGNILSLVIEHRTVEEVPNSFFDVYNFDIETGEQLTGADIVAASTTELKKTRNYAKEKINKIYDAMEKDADSATKARIANARQVSTSDENLEQCEYYFNAKKNLIIIYHYKGVNGAIGYAVHEVTKATMKEDKKGDKQTSEQKSATEAPANKKDE